jgi:hypothetical protein
MLSRDIKDKIHFGKDVCTEACFSWSLLIFIAVSCKRMIYISGCVLVLHSHVAFEMLLIFVEHLRRISVDVSATRQHAEQFTDIIKQTHIIFRMT